MPRTVSPARRQITARARCLVDPEQADVLVGTPEQFNRRIERWRADRLGPIGDLDPDREAAHYAALAEEGGRGTVADTTALRLARRGFPTERYRSVLRSTWGLDTQASGPTDPYLTGEDPALDMAAALVDEPRSSASDLDRLWNAMLDPIRRQGDNLDVATLGDVVALAMGGAPIEATNPVGGQPWPHISPRHRPWEAPPGPSPLHQVAICVERSLPEVVAHIPIAAAVLAQVDPKLDGDQLGDLAALVAPMQVPWSRRQRAAMAAWARTGGRWSVDHAHSSPQFAMSAEQLRPHDQEDRVPAGHEALVVDIGPPEGEREERLVLRRRLSGSSPGRNEPLDSGPVAP